MEFHEVAAIFPMMDDEQFESLKDDIAKHGLIEPIVVHQGKIVDGRNRFRACSALGIQPRFKEWGGPGSLLSFVVSANLKRRHLTSSQRAVIARAALPLYEAESKERMLAGAKSNPTQKIGEGKHNGEAAAAAAKDFGTNRQYIADVKAIETEAPEKIEEIKSGQKNIAQARKEVLEKRNALARPLSTPVSNAMQFAIIAISQLERIREDDPGRIEALGRVAEWIEQNRRK